MQIIEGRALKTKWANIYKDADAVAYLLIFINTVYS